jgi:hypothetical protein
MGGNNKKGNLRAIPPQFSTQAAQLIITAYTDRPPALHSTGDLVGAIRLLATGVAIIANSVGQMMESQGEADQMDKKREFLGPREG